MLVFEFKAYAKSSQLAAVNEAIRTAQFVRTLRFALLDGQPKHQ